MSVRYLRSGPSVPIRRHQVTNPSRWSRPVAPDPRPTARRRGIEGTTSPRDRRHRETPSPPPTGLRPRRTAHRRRASSRANAPRRRAPRSPSSSRARTARFDVDRVATCCAAVARAGVRASRPVRGELPACGLLCAPWLDHPATRSSWARERTYSRIERLRRDVAPTAAPTVATSSRSRRRHRSLGLAIES